MASLSDPGRLEDGKGPEPFNPGLSEFCWVCERGDEMSEHRSQMVLPYKLDLAQRYIPVQGHTGNEAGSG